MKRIYASRMIALLLVLVLCLPILAYAADVPASQSMPQAEPQPVPIAMPADPQPVQQPIIPQTSPQPPPRDLTELFIAIISLASVILTVFASPLIKAKVEESKLKKMMEVADTAVGAAWDMLKTQPGQERLQYALKVMRGYGYTANTPMIEDMLKSAWVRLKNELIASGNLTKETRIVIQPPDASQGA